MAAIGIGIVGCGRNGLNHAEIWQSMDEAEIVAVCDIDPAAAEERAKLFGVKAFTSVEEMVKEAGIDAVDVVNASSHRDPAVIAADAGKHVMVEVAFANSVEDADEMVAAAERSGVNMMYAQTHRFFSQNLTAKELIDRGEIGEPISMIITTCPGANESGSATAPVTAWYRWRATGGGFFMFEAPHLTDQISWLMGSRIETVFAVGMGRYVSEGDGEDNGLAGFGLSGGAFAAIHRGCTATGARISDWRLIGTEGALDVAHGSYVRLGKDGEWEDVPFPYKDAPMVKTGTREKDALGYHGFRAEFEEFVASIVEGREPSCSAYDGRAAVEAALAVIESHETGQPVSLRPGR